MKLAVYGNCQAPGFAASLEALLPGSEVAAFEVQDGVPAADAYDLVFTQPQFTGRFPAAAADRLRLFPSILFTGFHPDCIYIPDGPKKVSSPVGELHSSLVAVCFLTGVRLDAVPEWLTSAAFARLGYLAEFDRAAAFLAKTAEGVGIDLTAALAGWRKRRASFMYTINHPAIFALRDICRLCLARDGFRELDGERLPPDLLSGGAAWPIYQAVADRLGIDEQPAFRLPYWVARREGREAISFAEFAAACYRLYEGLPRELIATAPSVARLLKMMR